MRVSILSKRYKKRRILYENENYKNWDINKKIKHCESLYTKMYRFITCYYVQIKIARTTTNEFQYIQFQKSTKGTPNKKAHNIFF